MQTRTCWRKQLPPLRRGPASTTRCSSFALQSSFQMESAKAIHHSSNEHGSIPLCVLTRINTLGKQELLTSGLMFPTAVAQFVGMKNFSCIVKDHRT